MQCRWCYDMKCKTWTKCKTKDKKLNHGGNNITHLRKRQELELRIWKVVSGALQIGRCRILSWASHGNFSLVFPRPPLTVRCFLWLKKEKNKTMKTKSSSFIFLAWISSLHGHANFFTFKVFMKVFRNTKIFSQRCLFLGVDFSCKYQTPHRLIDLCTLTHALVP